MYPNTALIWAKFNESYNFTLTKQTITCSKCFCLLFFVGSERCCCHSFCRCHLIPIDVLMCHCHTYNQIYVRYIGRTKAVYTSDYTHILYTWCGFWCIILFRYYYMQAEQRWTSNMFFAFISVLRRLQKLVKFVFRLYFIDGWVYCSDPMRTLRLSFKPVVDLIVFFCLLLCVSHSTFVRIIRILYGHCFILLSNISKTVCTIFSQLPLNGR